MASARAMVGGASLPDASIARHVVLIVGGHSLCTGVAIAPDLVLTAAHCVQGKGKYRLVAFDGRRPAVKDVATIVAHPQFSLNATSPDIALLKLALPAGKLFPAPLSYRRAPAMVGDRFLVAGFGVAAQGERRTAGTKLAAPEPRRSEKAWRTCRSRRVQRRFRWTGVRPAGSFGCRDRELVRTP